jgi:hypothetical protein
MSAEQSRHTGTIRAEPDFAQVGSYHHLALACTCTDVRQALKDLARGERAAAAMENHLDSLEKKIEELLAKADEDEKNLKLQPKASEPTSTNDNGKGAA